MKRIFYALLGLCRYYGGLRNIPRISTVLVLSPAVLQAQGIEVLILDFDGVLAPDGDIAPLPSVMAWLHQAVGVFGESRLFLLTNKPKPVREAFFKQHFPTIGFIQGVRKKPYPDGILHIVSQTGVAPSRVMLVDDRALTGLLAAEISGIQSQWVRAPWMNIRKHPCSEIGFFLLRAIEKILIH